MLCEELSSIVFLELMQFSLMYDVCKLSIKIIGVYGQDFTVIVSRIPAGDLMGIFTYDISILSNLTLTCELISATDQTEGTDSISCTAPISGVNKHISGPLSGINNVFNIIEMFLIVMV